MFLLSSCQTGQSTSNNIVGTNYGAGTWRVSSAKDDARTGAFENKYGEIGVDIEFMSSAYIKRIDYVPFPLPMEIKCKRDDQYIYIYIESRYIFTKQTVQHQYNFDSTKVYFIRNGQRYYLNKRSNIGKAVELSPTLFDVTATFDRTSRLSVTYDTPFICGELENAIIVVDGITLNGKPLEPLMIRLNDLDPSTVPRYQGR
jgi:hypothetical protein